MKSFFLLGSVLALVLSIAILVEEKVKYELKGDEAIFNPILDVRGYYNRTYVTNQLVELTKYDYGYLEEPNKFVIKGNYNWQNYDLKRKISRIDGLDLEVYFDARTMLETLSGASVKEVEFKRQFGLFGKQFNLKSYHGTYYKGGDVLIGTDPAYISGRTLGCMHHKASE